MTTPLPFQIAVALDRARAEQMIAQAVERFKRRVRERVASTGSVSG